MPQKFCTAYSATLGVYVREKPGAGMGLLGKDPLTETTLDVSTTVFADDLAELTLTPTTESACACVGRATRLLDVRPGGEGPRELHLR